MKNLIIIIIAALSLSCNAQHIVPLFEGPLDAPSNPYYKDVDNDFNAYIGEWKWESDNDSWTIQFQKKIMVPSGGNAFDDVLIGEYKYIDDGIEIVNELPLVPNSLNNLTSHNLWGGNISTRYRGIPPCDECAEDSRFIIMSFEDPSRPGILGEVIFTRYIENLEEKLKLRLRVKLNQNYLNDLNYDGPNEFSMPDGDYIFVKQ